jgi:putative phage-type endonuclease
MVKQMAEVIQGTQEWHRLRLGKVTASRIKDVMATIKSGEAATRKNYRAQLVAERLSGYPTESFTSSAMQWGTEHEPIARGHYEVVTGLDVVQVAFIDHPEIEMAGASPDGLVGEDGLIEIKCPNTATHIDYLLTKSIPTEYQLQMLWQMACTGRQWCDFVSYDPHLPDGLQLLCMRFERDEKRIVEISESVAVFLQEVEQVTQQLIKAAA